MIGQKLIFLDSVDSTNNYIAKLNVDSELASGTVVLADSQFSGKGQRGASWESQPGLNLTMSIYFKPEFLSLSNQISLNFWISNAICSYLISKGIDAQIKWPNDILVSNKKIGGVLIENHCRNEYISSSIIGVGLNVNQTLFETALATSMKLEGNQVFLINDVMYGVLNELNNSLNLIGHQTLKNLYLKRMWLRGQLSWYTDCEGVFEGEIQGVDDFGDLVILRASGLKKYSLKELVFNERIVP
jgi:BirA family transcriptional regulator, biotin operon repressor / biotin---[acetyl-CoA-carboxylase] ligase